MVSFEGIKQAYSFIKPVVHETPLDYSHTFSLMSGCQVYLKLENLQKTGSFKVRGAIHKMSALSEAEKKGGIIAASAGNHAQGVAFAATEAGLRSTIVMPEGTPLAKVEATRRYGAEVILQGTMLDESLHHARQLQKQEGMTFVHPFDDEQVIEGQGTLGIEILQQLPDADAILCPIGGGGLISGVAIAAKTIKPAISIYGVESSLCASMLASIQQGKVTTVSSPGTIADGIAVKTPGKLTLDLVRRYVDGIVTVEDEEIARTMLQLLERSKLLVEGSGAASLAALLYEKIQLKGKKVVCLISGGNVDIHFISRIIEHGLIEAGRYIRFFTVIPDKPGQLNRLLNILAEQKANIISIAHNRMVPHLFPGQVEVDFSLETRDHQHIQNIEAALKQHGYALKKET